MEYNHPFHNRIFTLGEYTRLLNDAFSTMPTLRKVSRSGLIPRSFSERIMLAVTQVNGCRYCAYGHTKMALEAGVPEAEILQLMQGEFDDLPANEVKALLFAEHYADTVGNPDPEMCAALLATYGHDVSAGILAYSRMIMIGNALGNMFDAFLYRLRLRPVPGSRFLDEIGVLFGSLLLIPILGMYQALRHLLVPTTRCERLSS